MSSEPSSPDADVDATPANDERAGGGGVGADRRRRLFTLGALAVLVIAIAAVAAYVGMNEKPLPPKPDIALDAWAPYWALDGSLPDVDQRGPSMREISPFWFNAAGVDQIIVDPNASVDATDQFIAEARSAGVAVVPSIIDALPAGAMAAILADPTSRARHVEAIRAFAAAGGYDGVDIDYEQFAFSDGRDTWATTRPNWVSFIEELSAALHGDGRILTVSIPPVYDAGQTADSGYWVYDYGAIVDHVDKIRIMAYDYSVTTPGPIAPIDWVESTVTGAIDATGSPDKLVLGLPAYGRNWPISTSGVCPTTGVPGRTTVSARNIDDLIQRRNARPRYVEQTGEWTFQYTLEVTDGTATCVQTRQVNYVDGAGIRQRMDLARDHRIDGVALWAFGFDDAAVWDAILPTVADPRPPITIAN
jgi:spore germination protein YaaH